MDAAGLTDRQRKWFASVREGLERDTGKTLEQWIALAQTCPHQTPAARKAWLRTEHGLGINRASYVLSEAFPENRLGWDQPQALRAGLWTDPGGLAILEALEGVAAGWPDVTVGQRKGYTAFSAAVQFAAARPLKSGGARLGLKLDPQTSSRLTAAAGRESWSERLVSRIDLGSVGEVDGELIDLFGRARRAGDRAG